MDIKDLLGEDYREDMTLEEVQTALRAKFAPELATAQADVARYKSATTKANSEAAEYKRKLRDRQSEEEVRVAESEEKMNAIIAERDALKRERDIGKHRAEFLAQGYEAALAEEAAIAMHDGDTAKVFAAMKKHQEDRERTLRADLMRETPQPTAGGNGQTAVGDFTKQIHAAQEAGDYARAAALMRQQQMEAAKNHS
jgi:hypothetical protein